MNNSFELLEALKNANLLQDATDVNWWPNSGSFEVVVGAILTQQTKWEKVEKSLNNLRDNNLLDLEKLTNIDTKTLATLIKPSGFYNTKAKRLSTLCRKIIEEFGDFENFKTSVNREWILEQKGVGQESADAILCYACEREVLVVDNYTNKILKEFGYEFDSYEEIQQWMVQGILENMDRVDKLYECKLNLSTIYSRFHGKIVEFGKSKKDIKDLF